MSHSNPCPGSSRYIAHQQRVICGALGETIRYGVCDCCGQRVQIGPDDRLIRHRPQAARPTVLLAPAQQRIRARLQRTAGVA